jgi:predicted nucleic-acid-binding protein
MTTPFIDTDVIIRFLTSDDLIKQAEAAQLFEQVKAGTLAVAAPVTVIADAVYVLSSPRLYSVPRATVCRLLMPLVGLPGLRILHRRAVLRALELYGGANLDFGDALIVAEMERVHSHIVCSYDTHFDRVIAIQRVTPARLLDPSH